MDIASSSALQGYRTALAGAKPELADEPVSSGLKDSFVDFAQTLQHAEETAMASMTGDADPHALVQALAQSELAVETAVTVRNKVVEAYQEILRMPV